MYNEEDNDNLIANSCQNFLHFTCLILLTYKKTVVYKKHMQSGYSHLFGRLYCLERQKHFRSARKHSALSAALLQDYYVCFITASWRKCLQWLSEQYIHLPGVTWATEQMLLRGWVAFVPQGRNTCIYISIYVTINAYSHMCFFSFSPISHLSFLHL